VRLRQGIQRLDQVLARRDRRNVVDVRLSGDRRFEERRFEERRFGDRRS
jgi:hypothetical protein